jgi:hypothetical protein
VSELLRGWPLDVEFVVDVFTVELHQTHDSPFPRLQRDDLSGLLRRAEQGMALNAPAREVDLVDLPVAGDHPLSVNEGASGALASPARAGESWPEYLVAPANAQRHSARDSQDAVRAAIPGPTRPPTPAAPATTLPVRSLWRETQIDVVGALVAHHEDEQEGDYSSDEAAELDQPLRVGVSSVVTRD